MGSFPNTLTDWSRPRSDGRIDRLWRHRVSELIHNGVIGKVIGVLNAWKESKDTFPRFLREDIAHKLLLGDVTLTFPEEKEKRFVSNDRAPEPSAELVGVAIILAYVSEVVEPGIGAQGGVPILPE